MLLSCIYNMLVGCVMISPTLMGYQDAPYGISTGRIESNLYQHADL